MPCTTNIDQCKLPLNCSSQILVKTLKPSFQSSLYEWNLITAQWNRSLITSLMKYLRSVSNLKSPRIFVRSFHVASRLMKERNRFGWSSFSSNFVFPCGQVNACSRDSYEYLLQQLPWFLNDEFKRPRQGCFQSTDINSGSRLFHRYFSTAKKKWRVSSSVRTNSHRSIDTATVSFNTYRISSRIVEK